jgi:hypothetical protein
MLGRLRNVDGPSKIARALGYGSPFDRPLPRIVGSFAISVEYALQEPP